MAQFTSSDTDRETGVTVNAVTDTVTNRTTFTVTSRNGTVATASQNTGGLNTATYESIRQQLSRGADDYVFDIGLRTAMFQTGENTVAQSTSAPPGVQETQPIPASTAADPQVPQPGNNTPPLSSTEAADVNPDTDTNLSGYGEENDPPDLTASPAPVDSEFGNLDTAQAAAADSAVPVTQEDIDAGLDEALAAQGEEEDNAPRIYSPEDLGVEEEGFFSGLLTSGQQFVNRATLGNGDAINASQEAAVKERAKQQATFQARYKQPGNQDWRVRLSLSPNANYLYNQGTPRGAGAGILAPLAKTDGVIFPYTPSITTTYSANYEQYDLVHSNYRGVFYKNSRVGDINIRGTFTAQDSAEANYLLAVIHFFRSATKMFYGQDSQRGSPPPICLLNGLGSYQFSDHPVVISSFNYNTPNDVDYIRATNPNNYGSNMLNRRAAVASNPGGSALSGATRLINALLPKGAQPQTPNQGTVTGSVNNTVGATYVPTKIEIDITLIPVQTRTQVSKQFSLEGFAEGRLLKGGFW